MHICQNFQKSVEPHLGCCPYTPPDYKHTNSLAVRVHANGRMDTKTLPSALSPSFAVDNKLHELDNWLIGRFKVKFLGFFHESVDLPHMMFPGSYIDSSYLYLGCGGLISMGFVCEIRTQTGQLSVRKQQRGFLLHFDYIHPWTFTYPLMDWLHLNVLNLSGQDLHHLN